MASLSLENYSLSLCIGTGVAADGRRPTVQIDGRLSHEPAAGHHMGRILLVSVGVLDHPVLSDEALAADVAAEGLLAGVEAHVAPQVSLVVELLGAHFALVRLVPGMLGQVFLNQKECTIICRVRVYELFRFEQ